MMSDYLRRTIDENIFINRFGVHSALINSNKISQTFITNDEIKFWQTNSTSMNYPDNNSIMDTNNLYPSILIDTPKDSPKTLHKNPMKVNHIPTNTDKNLTSPVDDLAFYTPRRVSSLKTNRTPPGTPKSKAVRFADAFGLDLEDVRHIFNNDQPPKIPASAVKDLMLDNSSDMGSTDTIIARYLPNFTQPGCASDFLRHVRTHNVSLENSFIENNILSGTVRVMNITFDKKVTIRVTFNDWKSHLDVNGTYVRDSHDGVTDRFSFSLLMPPNCQVLGTRIQFALCYECSNGGSFWDNNCGRNYIFTCYGPNSSLPYDSSNL